MFIYGPIFYFYFFLQRKDKKHINTFFLKHKERKKEIRKESVYIHIHKKREIISPTLLSEKSFPKDSHTLKKKHQVLYLTFPGLLRSLVLYPAVTAAN